MFPDQTFQASLFVASALFSGLLGGLFLLLRVRGRGSALTTTQCWTLSILGWLFIVEMLQILSWVVWSPATRAVTRAEIDYAERITIQLGNITGGLLIAFGLVYPRPVARWSRLRIYLALLASGVVVVMAQEFVLETRNEEGLVLGISSHDAIYLVAWFLPIFIWLRQLESQVTAEGRMLTSLLIWGLLFNPLIYHLPILSPAVVATFLLLVVLRLVWDLIQRRDRWDQADRFHVAFLVASTVFVVIHAAVGQQAISYHPLDVRIVSLAPGPVLLIFVTNNLGWMLVRPALLSFGLLRYRLFGPARQIERPIAILLTLVGAAFLFALVQAALTGSSPGERLPAGAAVALIGIYPLWRLNHQLCARVLAMSPDETAQSPAERRATYSLTLQTAIVDGGPADPADEVVLEEVRTVLGISRREHDLLIASLAPADGAGQRQERLQEVFVMLADGRLVHHWSHRVAEEGDRELMAGMLTAIRQFVEEGLRAGGGELDAIRYGRYTLVMEAERGIVVAAVMDGGDSPDLRHLLHDALTDILRRFGAVLEGWDGDRDSVVGVEQCLQAVTTGSARPT